MLNGVRIYTNDDIWIKIMIDLSAAIVTTPELADVNIDSINLPTTISALELKSKILNAIDQNQQKIIKNIIGKNVFLPRLQMQIIVLLVQTGGMSSVSIKNVLGYSPDTATHTIDTAIYQLRKVYGHDFIENQNGIYRIKQ